jgi:hypothetical protein
VLTSLLGREVAGYIADPLPVTGRQLCSAISLACLPGLVRGGVLDKIYLNASAHHNGGYHWRHRIGIKNFMSLGPAQLERTLDQDCEPLEEEDVLRAADR